MADHQSVMINGQSVLAEGASVSIHDRGFRYGDGVFETIAVHGGVPYQWEYHAARLASGTADIKIDFDSSNLQLNTKVLLKANKASDCTLRIQVTRGVGSRGYLPTGGTPTCVIETLARPALPAPGVSLFTTRYAKPALATLPVNHKLCQGLNSTLARMEAESHGCFEALLLSTEGLLCEASSANLFWFKNGTLYTPALSTGALAGSTRAALLRLHAVQQVEAPLAALLDADEVFLANTSWQVLAVASLAPQGKIWKNGPATAQLAQKLAADIAQYSRDNQAVWA